MSQILFARVLNIKPITNLEHANNAQMKRCTHYNNYKDKSIFVPVKSFSNFFKEKLYFIYS